MFVGVIVIDATAFLIISIRDFVPTTASLPASPPASSFPFIAPKIVGELRIMPSSIAFLYQLILKCGTEGGLREKEPVMLTCGSFILGNDQEKLNIFFILSIAL